MWLLSFKTRYLYVRFPSGDGEYLYRDNAKRAKEGEFVIVPTKYGFRLALVMRVLTCRAGKAPYPDERVLNVFGAVADAGAAKRMTAREKETFFLTLQETIQSFRGREYNHRGWIEAAKTLTERLTSADGDGAREW